MSIPLCSSCILVTQLKEGEYETIDEGYKCSLCFGILSDIEYRKLIVKEVDKKFKSSGYDGYSIVIAINAPISMYLREFVMDELFDTWNVRDMSPKNLFANLLQKDIEIVGNMNF